METPSTPSKRNLRGEEINNIAEDLNRRWNLRLPVPDSVYSPSKSLKNTLESKIFNSIRYLYFKDQRALHECLDTFANHAAQAVVGKQLQNNSFNTMSLLPEALVEHITQLLHKLLTECKEITTSQGPSDSFTQSTRCGGSYTLPYISTANAKVQHPSLNGYRSTDANLSEESTDEEDFVTPPTTPSNHKDEMAPENSRRARQPENIAGQTMLSFQSLLLIAPETSFATTTTTTSRDRNTPNTSFNTTSTRRTSFNSVGAVMHDVEERQAKRQRSEDNSPASHLGHDELLLYPDLFTNDPVSSSTEPSVKPAPQPAPQTVPPVQRDTSIQAYLDTYLRGQTPFGTNFTTNSFKRTYEVARVALLCSLDPVDLLKQVGEEEDYGKLWSKLQTYVIGMKKKTMPERSETVAWDAPNYECVSFGSEISFNKGRNLPLLSLRLKPLKVDKSHRFARSLGSDRFLTIDLPGLFPKDLPQHLRSRSTEVGDAIVSWLISTHHAFLGRVWRAFFVKPLDRKPGAGGFRNSNTRSRIYLFATDGEGFLKSTKKHRSGSVRTAHHCMSVYDLVEWHMPPSLNADQAALKFFARIALGLSPTFATVEFLPTEIIRTHDAFADNPVVRRLSSTRHKEKDQNRGGSTAPIMNDGCGRISRAAAQAITEKLRLDRVPSAFQARFRGAKGVWFVDVLDENLSGSKRGFWIEITNSQQKFCPHKELFPDSARVTFEVCEWSKPLRPASLNFQLIPILVHRGVPREVLEKLLEDDLVSKVDNLTAATENSLNLRKWSQEFYPVTEERLRSNTIAMGGGLPDSLGERINFLTEHGFDPKTCKFLNKQCFTAIKAYCERLETRLNIEIGCSTYAYMVADPLAVLEENEIHFGFSGSFTDPNSKFNDTMLNDRDVLVARSPAYLPSDVQKVRAVFKPELSFYKDIIIFSSKPRVATGKSLADELSGGDFDGDKAWVCWLPEVVGPFSNAHMPTPPGPEYYGIKKDSTKVSDLIKGPNDIERFLEKGFRFNLQSSLLGTCAVYHERLCYHEKKISDPVSKEIACLLGYLVDAAKGGLMFTEKDWTDFRRSKKLRPNFPEPAYKDRKLVETKHVLDILVFEVAKPIRQKVLGAFDKLSEETVALRDDDLTALWKIEQEDPNFKPVAEYLKAKLQDLYDKFKASSFRVDDNGLAKATSNLSGTKSNFPAVMNRLRENFLAIQPPEDGSYYMLPRWRMEARNPVVGTSWLLLKASALFYRSYDYRNLFIWYIAGKEFGELKARAFRDGSTLTTSDIHLAMKVDAKYARRRNEGLLSIEDGPVTSQDDDFDIDMIEDNDLLEFADSESF
ncbi:MAG: hypothetical protein MMC33_004919 [Icmadophila ericetorum]|nr:hypothetical protein [Icmadophila ericetorum]